jgi:hypothetical protein
LSSHECATAWTDATHLDYDGVAHLHEVREIRGLRIKASGRQGLEQRRVRLLAIPCVPSVGKDCYLALVRMSVRSELEAGREF